MSLPDALQNRSAEFLCLRELRGGLYEPGLGGLYQLRQHVLIEPARYPPVRARCYLLLWFKQKRSVLH